MSEKKTKVGSLSELRELFRSISENSRQRMQYSEEKFDSAIVAMSKTRLHLPERSINMLDMVTSIGVALRIRYSSLQERKVKGGGGTTEVVNIVHDYGLIFRDGTEIRHVDKSIYAFFNEEPIIDKRERI